MPEFNVEVEFDVYCAKCGAALCPQSTAHDHIRGRNSGRYVDVEPCGKCIDEARDNGHADGYAEAEEAYRES